MATNWVDFAAVKAAVSMVMVLEHYGLALTPHGDELVGRCPIHKGEHNSRAFHVSTTKNAWHCFGDCRRGGNVLEFVAEMEQADLRDAALKLAEWFHVQPPDEPSGTSTRPAADRSKNAPRSREKGGRGARRDKSRSARSRATPAPSAPPSTPQTTSPLPDQAVGPIATVAAPMAPSLNPPLTFTLKGLDASHSYLTGRGLTADTIATFGLGYCGKGLMAGRVAIPIHDVHGQLVAYAGRAVTDDLAEAEGKYKLPGGFHKNLVLYNLHRAWPLAREHGLVLVEGYFSVLRLHQAGVLHAVALMGSTLAVEQEALVLAAVGSHGKVALMLDRDDAGRVATKELVRRLVPSYHLRVVIYDGHQPDDCSDDQLHALFLT